MKENEYYYEIHIFLGRDEGYSAFFKSKEDFGDDEDQIIEEGLKKLEHIKDDIEMCDYAIQISKDEYVNAIGNDQEEEEESV